MVAVTCNHPPFSFLMISVYLKIAPGIIGYYCNIGLSGVEYYVRRIGIHIYTTLGLTIFDPVDRHCLAVL